MLPFQVERERRQERLAGIVLGLFLTLLLFVLAVSLAERFVGPLPPLVLRGRAVISAGLLIALIGAALAYHLAGEG